MIPFGELTKLADEIRDKTGECCSVSVDYFAYAATPTNVAHAGLKYNLYMANSDEDGEFKTVQDLKDAMDKIIAPKDDDGVWVGEAIR